jgi:hypothetical protein
MLFSQAKSLFREEGVVGFLKLRYTKMRMGAFVEMDFDDNPFRFHTQCIRPIDINLDGNFEIVSSGSFEETVEEKKTNSETRLYTKNGDFLEKTILDTIWYTCW